ncbi:ABC transporter substrate binding protein [Variovorax sp. J22R115]|nr:ABC transporter substrate binding protein [Variovorax sp. J22R115]MDM0052562.1 ABC transporter substrate binding protein [Variovorax sp. J22R115]
MAVPVAYVFSGDPVSAGFAKGLARPDSNITGLTLLAAEMNGKLLEILREMDPSVRDVAIVANPEHRGSHIEREYTDGAARQLGLRTQYFPARTRDELASSLEAMSASPARALSIFSDSFAVANRRQILDFAIARKMPVMSGWSIFADSGALGTYGPRLVDSYARLAVCGPHRQGRQASGPADRAAHHLRAGAEPEDRQRDRAQAAAVAAGACRPAHQLNTGSTPSVESQAVPPRKSEASDT